MLIPKRGDEVTVEISAAAFEGKAVARIEGFVVFVDGAVPGDVVRVRIVKSKKQYAEARILEIETPSLLRTTPRCPHVGTCGGCKWQHVSYSAQLHFKQQQVREAFERIGGFASPEILPIIGADDIFFYRNKMEFSFANQQWLEQLPIADLQLPIQDDPIGNRKLEISNPTVFLGLHVPQRYDKVLDIRECHLQSEISNAILAFTREFARRSGLPVYSSESDVGYFRFLVIRQSKRTNELMVNLVTYESRPDVMKEWTSGLLAAVPGVTTIVNTINDRKAQIAFGDSEHVYHGDGVIHERLGAHTFTISAGSFFQTNTAQAEKLYSVAKDCAGLRATDTVYDLYSGTGSIALFISDEAGRVIGIESVESAVRDAERNAKLNGVTNCSFLLGDLKDRLTKDTAWMQSLPKPDVLVIDPPRSGMHPRVLEEIVKLRVPKLVYVSCNPATQARDVKALCEKNYRIARLQPVDMFPHTYHIENVALLSLR
jgi:23S rRNA (uracil1939-C5)-methyltransferase